ncbi:uncharacterized protein PV07_02386 [Cladophialophora immunda]|uniref:AMP-dependent synthetase/ligase domain-containing protein n=1 Tax=Cladophialophora immunda TaxID=569365 RepID=A0A0D2BDX0_9EURO|nr:uncharacterized protein PV07_02386 [Cladophialophora immunda]KIW35702.1 hypothetical protein PV07_02386 [Cladophialophora immunda]
MVIRSPLPDLEIPRLGLLDYIFPNIPDSDPSSRLDDESPIWIDAEDSSHTISRRQAVDWTQRLGSYLSGRGVKQGDVCLTLSQNHIFMPIAFYAIVGCGAAFSGLNPDYTVPELAYQIKKTRAKIILVEPESAQAGAAATLQAGLTEDILVLFSDRHYGPTHGIPDWRDLVPSIAKGWAWLNLTPSESISTTAVINFSSGTTGLPKGVCVSHRNLIANVEQTQATLGFSPSERWLVFLPMFHAYGQIYTFMFAPRLGIRTYIMRRFKFIDYLNAIQKYRINRLHSIPPVLLLFAKRPEVGDFDLSSVENILCVSAPLSTELQTSVHERLQRRARVAQGWGMTEATCAATLIPRSWIDHVGTVGVLIPNMEAKLIGEDDTEVVSPGVKREIHLRGPNVALGYFENQEATRDTFDDAGWLRTGDIAHFDENSYFRIVDRRKELIKVNAFQVSPAELEAVLLKNEDIADATVIGIKS